MGSISWSSSWRALGSALVMSIDLRVECTASRWRAGARRGLELGHCGARLLEDERHLEGRGVGDQDGLDLGQVVLAERRRRFDVREARSARQQCAHARIDGVADDPVGLAAQLSGGGFRNQLSALRDDVVEGGVGGHAGAVDLSRTAFVDGHRLPFLGPGHGGHGEGLVAAGHRGQCLLAGPADLERVEVRRPGGSAWPRLGRGSGRQRWTSDTGQHCSEGERSGGECCGDKRSGNECRGDDGDCERDWMRFHLLRLADRPPPPPVPPHPPR